MLIEESWNGFKVSLEIDSNYNTNEELKIRQAVRHIARAIGSNEFEEWCLNFSWEQQECSGRLWWKKCKKVIYKVFNWNQNKTNLEIYNNIMSGKEVLNPIDDKTANIKLKIDRRRSRGVIGYTYPNTITQWVYSWFLSSSYKEVAGNIFHEYCHKLGYDHAYRYSYNRQFTVPYAVGYFVANFTENSLE